jgi:arsenate reductase
MGCGEECPFVPGVRVEDWQLEDPKGQSLERVRAIRDEISRQVKRLIAAEGLSESPAPLGSRPVTG